MEIKIDICGLQEVRWRGASARLVEGKDSRYKMFWVGNGKSMSGVGILLTEKWVKAIFGVKRASNRIMLTKLVVGKSIVTVPSFMLHRLVLMMVLKICFMEICNGYKPNLVLRDLICLWGFQWSHWKK